MPYCRFIFSDKNELSISSSIDGYLAVKTDNSLSTILSGKPITKPNSLKDTPFAFPPLKNSGLFVLNNPQ